MGTGWSGFARPAHACDHGVQLYADPAELAETVVRYLLDGFEQDEPAVVVAMPEHVERFRARLQAEGLDVSRAEADRLVAFADAEDALARITDGEHLSPRRFEAVIGAMLDHAGERRPGKQIRVFGEIVDLLCRRGRVEVAIGLEQLWNDLAATRDFALLCGYEVDIFDRALQVGLLPRVCRAHSHIRPAGQPELLARAVDGALHDVLGEDAAGAVYRSVGRAADDKSVPAPQLILMWVSEHLPALAHRILAAARERYEHAAVAA